MGCLLLLWLGGVGTGAIHPLGALAATLGLVIFCWFTAALGVLVSLRAKNSIRALGATMIIFVTIQYGFSLLDARLFGVASLTLSPLSIEREVLLSQSVRNVTTNTYGQETPVSAEQFQQDSSQLIHLASAMIIYGIVAWLLTLSAYGLREGGGPAHPQEVRSQVGSTLLAWNPECRGIRTSVQ